MACGCANCAAEYPTIVRHKLGARRTLHGRHRRQSRTYFQPGSRPPATPGGGGKRITGRILPGPPHGRLRASGRVAPNARAKMAADGSCRRCGQASTICKGAVCRVELPQLCGSAGTPKGDGKRLDNLGRCLRAPCGPAWTPPALLCIQSNGSTGRDALRLHKTPKQQPRGGCLA